MASTAPVRVPRLVLKPALHDSSYAAPVAKQSGSSAHNRHPESLQSCAPSRYRAGTAQTHEPAFEEANARHQQDDHRKLVFRSSTKPFPEHRVQFYQNQQRQQHVFQQQNQSQRSHPFRQQQSQQQQSQQLQSQHRRGHVRQRPQYLESRQHHPNQHHVDARFRRKSLAQNPREIAGSRDRRTHEDLQPQIVASARIAGKSIPATQTSSGSLTARQRPRPPTVSARQTRGQQYRSSQREEMMAKQGTSPAERRILSGAEALHMCPDLLADYERNEICAFDKVYYIGSQTSKIARTAHGAFDTAEGEYIYVKGEQIAFRYELESKLGHGSFGQVFRCRDHKTQQQQAASIAIKMIRSVQRFRAQALVELRVLQRIRDRDPQGVSRVVTLLDHFWFRDHLCLVFPMYSKNLYEVLRANEHHGLAEKPVLAIAKQLLAALRFLRDADIIHCDIKPENILLEDGPRRPREATLANAVDCMSWPMTLADGTILVSPRIRLVDLGSACLVSEQVHTYIQSRFYRAPEVILGAPTGVAVDMWSCGCVLAELMVGLPLFPGQNELEQLALIVAIRGQPIREGATRWSKFFHRSSGAPRWTQNTSFPKPGSLSLRRALAASTFSNEHLFEIVCKCLVYDPRTRIEPKAALKLLAEASS